MSVEDPVLQLNEAVDQRLGRLDRLRASVV
jgi:hypothetical protein